MSKRFHTDDRANVTEIGVDFHAKSVGRTGTVFESIDLSEKEWTEYDEEGDLSVSVMELEYKIE